jgi:glycosyltransferase involved in cell wall biosynthesis
MHIAHIAPAWITVPPKNYGGTETVMFHLVEQLVALGHDVTLFAPGDARTSAKHISFFPTSLIPSGVPWQAHLKADYHVHCALEYINAHAFDVVHTHLSTSADMALFPLTASLPTPHVTTLHSPFPFDNATGGWIGDADQYYLSKWGSRVPMIAISQSAQAQAPKDVNFVGVVHHGIRLQDYQPTANGKGAFFAWLGRFVPEKGAHLAIQAATQAGVPLVLAGNVQHHHESQQYFHESIQPHIDGKQVTYVGPVNLKQKIRLLSQARGLLNPIEWEEPFGMVMIEAMALGCPVISFARGAAPELIMHGKTGFLVHNVQQMVRSMAHIGKIDRAVTRSHVERSFSAQKMAEHYVDIYRRVMRMSTPASRPTVFDAPPHKALIPARSVRLTAPLPALNGHQKGYRTKQATGEALSSGTVPSAEQEDVCNSQEAM